MFLDMTIMIVYKRSSTHQSRYLTTVNYSRLTLNPSAMGNHMANGVQSQQRQNFKFHLLSNTKKFSIHSQQLPNMPHKYLSITPYINTKFNTHTDSIQHKANRTLGLLRRNLHGCARHKTHNLQHICISNTLALRSRVGPTHRSKY